MKKPIGFLSALLVVCMCGAGAAYGESFSYPTKREVNSFNYSNNLPPTHEKPLTEVPHTKSGWRNLTDEEVALAKNLFHEVRGEPTLGQYAAAGVTLGRMKDRSRHFGGSSLEGVIYKRKQFSWTNNSRTRNSSPWLYRKPEERAAWDRVVQVAVNSLQGTVPYDAQQVLDAIEEECIRYYKTANNAGTTARGRAGFKGLKPKFRLGVHMFYTDPKARCSF